VAEIRLEGVGKIYPDGTEAVRDLNLDIADGELMVLVGPSGCGKTTALRMVAGLETITSGQLTIEGVVVNDLPPRDRDVAMVFQNYALYPHKTVFDNLGFPLKLRRLPKPEIERRVRRIAVMLGLEEHLSRRPRQLSGGQRQRVAMGRAMVREPQAFLMDEPLSNLDAKLRTQMRAEVRSLQQELGITTIYVTHDQVEAMTLGDRVAVMRKGDLQQVASPQELYERPVNVFVAGFIGSPAMNFVEADLQRRDGRLVAAIGDDAIVLDEAEAQTSPALAQMVGRRVVLGIRPEHLAKPTTNGPVASGRIFRGSIRLVEALGSETIVHFDVRATPVLTDELRELALDVDAAALGDLERDRSLDRAAFVARFGGLLPAPSGETIEVAVSPERLHFFDPATGRSL
jgi:multiple sugar transport system ATP-binding protein